MNIGLMELVVVFVVALIVIGPDKLPTYAKKLGVALREFRKASEDLTKDFQENVVVPLDEAQRPLREAIEPLQELEKGVRSDIRGVESSLRSIGKPKKAAAAQAAPAPEKTAASRPDVAVPSETAAVPEEPAAPPDGEPCPAETVSAPETPAASGKEIDPESSTTITMEER